MDSNGCVSSGLEAVTDSGKKTPQALDGLAAFFVWRGRPQGDTAAVLL